MAIEIGAIRAMLSLDSAKFVRGAKLADGALGDLQVRMRKVSRKLSGFGRKITTGVTAPLAAMAGLAVRSSLQTVDAQAKLAQSLNTTVASMQVLERAGELAGVSVSGLEQLSKDLTRRLSQAAESGGPAAKTLKKLGLSAGDLLKMPLDERIVKINTAIQEFVPKAQQAAVAGKLFGEEGSIAAMRLDPATIAAAADEIERFGVAVSEVDADAIEAANDAMSQIGVAVRGISNQLTVALAPTLQLISEKISDVADWFGSLSDRTKRLIGVSAVVAAAVGPVILALGGLAAGASLVVGGFALVLPVIAAVAPAMGVAAVGAGAFWLSLQEGEGWLGRIGAAIRATPLGWMASQAWKAAKAVAGFVSDAGGISGAVKKAGAAISEVFGRVPLVFELISARAAQQFWGVSTVAVEVFSSILSAASGFANKYIGLYVGIYKGVVAAWGALPGAFKSIGARAINALIDVMQGGLAGVVSGVNSLLSAVYLPTIDPPDLSGWRQEVSEATGVLSAAGSAFKEAFNGDYVGGVVDAVSGFSDETANAAASAKLAGDAIHKKLTAPVKALEKTAVRSTKKLTRMERALGGAGDAASDATKEVVELGDAGEDAGGKIAGGGSRAAKALDKVKTAAEKGQEALASVVKGFSSELVTGGAGSAFDKFLSDITAKAADAFSGIWENAFKPGGGGFSEVWNGISDSFKGVAAGLKGVFSGGGLGAVGSLFSSALPVIGGVIGIVNLIKGFSSKKTIGTGLDLNVTGGQIGGSQWEKIKRTSFWGLFSSTKDKHSSLSDDLKNSIQAQVDLIQKTAGTLFNGLGVKVSGQFIDAIEHASQRIDTTGLSKEDAEAKVAEFLTGYGDAVAKAIAGVGVEQAQLLASVQGVLAPLGKEFSLFAGRLSGVAGQIDLGRFAKAADHLAGIAGGVEALAAKTASFFDKFYSEEQKLSVMRDQVSSVFSGLGRGVPKTHEAFRDLVLSQDLLTKSGRKTYNALLDIAPVFDQVASASDAARAALSAMRSDRDGLLFDLLPDGAQVEAMRADLASRFRGLGIAVPAGLDGLRNVLSGLNLNTQAGRDAFNVIRDLVPDFRRVLEVDKRAADLQLEAADKFAKAVSDMRGAYSLDASGFVSEWQAKLSDEIRNPGRFDQELITAQNDELARQSSLLERILDSLAEGNALREDDQLLSQMR